MKELLRSCSIKSKLIFSFLFIVLLTVVLDFFAIKSLNEAKEFGQAKVEHLQQRYGRTRRTGGAATAGAIGGLFSIYRYGG